MATYQELTDTVLQTHRGLVDLADAAASQATASLLALEETQETLLELTETQGRLVNTDVSATPYISWTHTIDGLTAPSEDNCITDLPPVVTVPDKVKKPGLIITSPGSYSANLDATPEPLAAANFSDIPDLELMVFASEVIPAFGLTSLTDEFAYSIEDYKYTEVFSAEVRSGITNALGGSLGLPESYWTAIWERASDDIARTRVAALRNARNSGASSYWPLPGEAVIKASQRVLDETTRSLQTTRLEQAVQEAVFAREDFWKAIETAVKYDQAWADLNEKAAQRALAAEEAAHNVRVAVHNSNVADFNARLERAKVVTSLNELAVRINLEQYKSLLTRTEIELKQDAQVVARHQEAWTAWTAKSDSQYKDIATRLQWWNAQTISDIKYEGLLLENAKIQAEAFTEQLGKIVAVSGATAQLLAARTGASRLDLDIQDIKMKSDIAHNTVEVNRAQTLQTGKISKAELDIKQAEWISNQGVSLQNSATQMAVGYAQAILQASDVSLSSGTSFGLKKGQSASQNSPLDWGSESL
jgi:hypothetical protein